MLSDWGMGWLEDTAVENAPKDWAASLQLKCASTYGLTLRRTQQREAFKTFLKYFPKHPRCGYAKFMIAVSMEKDHEFSKRQAAQAYQDFLDIYAMDPVFRAQPDSQEYINEAARAVQRLPIN